ncbi:hypothetical protein KF282_1105 [Lactococcus lactis subsp. lactis]|uniref:DUF4062 domain-containing protein n=1 Tax=Lactococcus lactis subsp. lactis TaxID=1360 RepID=A0A0V8CYX9_LACLL|nr:DUF4062 domain-containing protein [Lactococcus lactis]KSU06514.1 hypothetical protein KF282_1105 [Lactococcus lactis subsp. lactis]
MEKKYQVFISSTYTDLIEERQKVVEAILNAGHIPAGMELFKAGPTQEDIIKEWIEASDIYVLILGPRYGSLNKDGISYTQWEYNLAKKLDKPMFSLVLTDDYIQKMTEDKRLEVKDLEISDQSYKAFKKDVFHSLVVNIDHPAEIRSGISDCIRDIERRYPEKLEGWIKGSYLNELEELREENKKLSLELVTRQGEVIGMQKKAKPVKDDYIGEFSFDAIREVLEASVITEEQFDDAIRELETKKNEYFSSEPEYDEYVSRISYARGSSALQYFVYSRSRLLAKQFQKPKDNPLDKIINDNFVSLWEQYSLVVKQVVVSGTNFKLTQYGMKFIGMLDIFSVENEK